MKEEEEEGHQWSEKDLHGAVSFSLPALPSEEGSLLHFSKFQVFSPLDLVVVKLGAQWLLCLFIQA